VLQFLEDGPAGRVTQGVKGFLAGIHVLIVSIHLP
jgi:hypothetical protein